MTFINNVNLSNKYHVSSLPHIGFRGSSQGLYPNLNIGVQDSFSTNPLYENLGTKAQIEAAARSNPRIVEILKENNIPLKINIEEFENLKNGHLKHSRITAAKLYSSLPPDLKKEVNLSDLQEAAMFHDYGKVLIPKEILNKKGTLTPDEKKIMELHSELGYELLKNQKLKESVLNLIKYHHQNPHGTGYPSAANDFKFDTSAQILSAADKYSALTEKRSYKDAMSKEQALSILQEDVNNGQISQEVFDALKKSLS